MRPDTTFDNAALVVQIRGHKPSRDEWPAPRPLPSELRPVLPFDYELLPDSLRPWVRDIAERMQCPPEYVATPAIVAAASLVGRRASIRPQRRDDWTEYGNLWGVIVGRPGTLKSPAIGEATACLRRYGAEEAKKFGEALKEHARELEVHDARKELSRKALRRADGKAPAVDIVTDLDAPQQPQAKRFYTTDSTVEALHELCCQNPGGLLVLRDEVAGLLRRLDDERYAGERAFYLTAWNGNSSYVVDRIGRGNNLSAVVNISLLGGTQPGKIAGYVRHAVSGAAGDDGLLQRFSMLVWPDHSAEWKSVDRYPDAQARQQAYRAFDGLRNLNPMARGGSLGEFDGPDPVPFWQFCQSAQEAFSEFRGELERNLRSGELHPALESHLAKYRKLVPALALIFHLMEGHSGAIDDSATLRAISWAGYLRSHAERLYGAALGGDVAVAKAILAKLKAGAFPYADGFVARDIYRNCWTGLDIESTESGCASYPIWTTCASG